MLLTNRQCYLQTDDVTYKQTMLLTNRRCYLQTDDVTYKHTQTHTHTNTHAHTNTHTQTCTHARTHARMHAQTHTHSHTHLITLRPYFLWKGQMVNVVVKDRVLVIAVSQGDVEKSPVGERRVPSVLQQTTATSLSGLTLGKKEYEEQTMT